MYFNEMNIRLRVPGERIIFLGVRHSGGSSHSTHNNNDARSKWNPKITLKFRVQSSSGKIVSAEYSIDEKKRIHTCSPPKSRARDGNGYGINEVSFFKWNSRIHPSVR